MFKSAQNWVCVSDGSCTVGRSPFFVHNSSFCMYKMFSYHRKTTLQGALALAKSGRLELGDDIYGYYRSIFSHCDTIGLQSYRIPRKKRKIRAIMPFKVIQGHRVRYRSKARMRLPISNWHPISYRFGVIAAYSSNFGHLRFWSPFGGLGTTYDVHLGRSGKRVVDFLLVLTELLSLGVTAESLRANIGSTSAISLQWGQLTQNFR